MIFNIQVTNKNKWKNQYKNEIKRNGQNFIINI